MRVGVLPQRFGDVGGEALCVLVPGDDADIVLAHVAVVRGLGGCRVPGILGLEVGHRSGQQVVGGLEARPEYVDPHVLLCELGLGRRVRAAHDLASRDPQRAEFLKVGIQDVHGAGKVVAQPRVGVAEGVVRALAEGHFDGRALLVGLRA